VSVGDGVPLANFAGSGEIHNLERLIRQAELSLGETRKTLEGRNELLAKRLDMIADLLQTILARIDALAWATRA
jgi:hypothetical protein